MTTTAQVEVLTAEVRALMVGSRQVTLSVYRQLDEVKPWELEPFGRVRDSKDVGSCLWAIGRDIASGTLVRAHREKPYNTPISPPELPRGWFKTYGVERNEAFGQVRKTYTDPYVVLAISEDSRHQVEWIVGARRQNDLWSGRLWCFETPEVQTQALKLAAGQLAAKEKQAAEYHKWEQLPLIILAGLR